MAAGSLLQAAQQCYSHMFAYWTAGTLSNRFTTFNAAIVTAFPSDGGDNDVKQRTVSNWIVIGRKIQNGPLISSSDFNAAVQYVFRLLTAANAAQPLVGNRISATQATAILAAYNASLD